MNKNVPNILTIIRICLVPFFVFFYLADFIDAGKVIALAIFIFASITDFVDGKLARKYKITSSLGKFLDPIADKVLVLSALLVLAFDGTIPSPYGLIALLVIVSRDYVVDVIRQLGASKGKIIPADIWGKSKTMITMIALTLLLAYVCIVDIFDFSATINTIIHATSLALFGIGVVLTIFSGCNYVIKNLDLLTEKTQKDNEQ